MAVDLGTAKGRIEIDAKGVVSGMQQAGKSIQGFQAGITLCGYPCCEERQEGA